MVIAGQFKLMPQLDNLHANEAIEYHDNDNDKPYGSIVENYAEEHPFGRDRTPKRLTAIHMASLRGVDEEEGYSRGEYKGSNYTDVLHLELAQSFSIVVIEDSKEDVASHCKCP